MKLSVLILLILCVVAIFAGAWLLARAFLFKKPNPPLPERELRVGEHVFTVELATSTLTRMRGLSHRTELPQDHGMLFVFPFKGSYSFWMKDMRIPLDLIWISGDKVVGITENVQPPGEDGSLQHYYPPEAVDRVLEVNAGASAAAGITTGSEVKFRQ